MDRKLLEEIWTRYLTGGEVTAREQEEIVAAVDADQTLKRALLGDRHLHGLLGVAAREGDASAAAETQAFLAGLAERIGAERDGDRFTASMERRLRTAAERRSGGGQAVDPHAPGLRAPAGRARLLRRAVPWTVALAAAAAAVVLAVKGDREAAPRAQRIAPETGAAGQSAGGGVAPAATPSWSDVVARLARVEGTVYVLADAGKLPARAGQELRGGHGVVTVGRQSAARVAFADGTEIELGPDATVAQVAELSPASGAKTPAAVRAKRVFLTAGTLRATVPTQLLGASFAFATPHVLVSGTSQTVAAAGTPPGASQPGRSGAQDGQGSRARGRSEDRARAGRQEPDSGTRLVLSASTANTRVTVDAGRVELRGAPGASGRAAGAVTVEHGQQALVGEGAAPVVSASQPGGLALFFVGSLALRPGDEAAKRRLEQLGFEVRVRGAGAMTDADAKYAALFVISSTIESVDLNTRFRELPVPILTWEDALFDDLGLTGPTEKEDYDVEFRRRPEIMIKDALHPLAAGFSDVVRVTTTPTADFVWGAPGPLASWIATIPGHPTSALIFAYERGTAMVGLTAPARRVAFFPYDDAMAALNEAGWALFDAAVRWCSERRAEP